jgi:predicted amidophosphoribosyltransferase
MAICPACGLAIEGDEKTCPRCGWEFSRPVKFDCPYCGALIPVKAEACPVCGIGLKGLSSAAKSQSIDKVRAVLLADYEELKRSETEAKEKRFKCPKCGALLDGSEPTCPECSQFLITQTGLKCPVCSTAIEKRRRKCPKCGISLSSTRREALPMVPFVPEQVAEPGVEAEGSAVSGTCPVCGATFQGDSLRCPGCGADLARTRPKPLPTEVTPPPISTPVPVVGAAAESKKIRRVRSAKKVPPFSVGQTPEVVESSPPSEPEMPAEASAPGTELERTTTVDYSAKEGPRGMSNGLARTNGARPRVGESFVNGTGISNGLGPRKRAGSAKRPMSARRWQFIAVLVVLALLIPAFMYMSYESKKSNLVIDGKFQDWADIATYGTRIASSSSSSNITEWSVTTQTNDLYLYFKTQDPMMSSSDPESFYLFVDSDGNNGTGYAMESIGADYLLVLTGWDNAVNSSSLQEYSSTTDQLDWNAWTYISSLTYSSDGLRMEAKAALPSALGGAAKFILVSKDSSERGSVSYLAPIKGAGLLVTLTPSTEVSTDGIVPKSNSVAMVTLKFTAEGGGGTVEQIHPYVVGGFLATQPSSFSLKAGEVRELTLFVDTTASSDGQLVSLQMSAENITSTFASVEMDGSSEDAYVVSPPPGITIDGAFADWSGRLSADADTIPVSDPDVDITAVGNVSGPANSYFYVSVEGQMCNGAFVPATVAKPSGSGGGVVVHTRKTAEDILRIYVDSDRSNSTGQSVSLGPKVIGADQMIEVRGLFGRITSSAEFVRSPTGTWVETAYTVDAAKDSQRIEIGVSAASLGGSADVDFIVETTAWNGRGDFATFDPSAMIDQGVDSRARHCHILCYFHVLPEEDVL